MSWSSPVDLKAQLERLWARGDFFRDAVGAHTLGFPLRLQLKAPASADMTHRFDEVRSWAATLAALPAVRLELQDIRHRVQGLQRVPVRAWVDSLPAAVDWLGKQPELDQFVALYQHTRDVQPLLLPWLERRPFKALELAAAWPKLLAVIGWCLKNPRPNIYIRQVDLPGVHSKFIESHRPVLAELLSLCLTEGVYAGFVADSFTTPVATPAATLVATPAATPVPATATIPFESRFGFRTKPARVRCRILDPEIAGLPGTCCPDITLDADSFSNWISGAKRVFITENEINFLAFPPVPGALVVFGSGYGWAALSRARWLAHLPLHYWGDIDTHGFAILNQLRTHFPHAVSFLMDRNTLMAHQPCWGLETAPTAADLPMLNQAEQALYDDLRHNRIQPQLRLEQELIRFQCLAAELNALL